MKAIKFPVELVAEIDRFAGRRQRTAFVIDIVQRELQRMRQLAAVRASAGAWAEADHPELQAGGAAFVEQLRKEDRGRLDRSEPAR